MLARRLFSSPCVRARNQRPALPPPSPPFRMMDLVSVGFAKPESSAGRSMTCAADVVAAYRAFQRERPPVTDAVGGAPASAKSIGAGADAAAVPGAARPLALRAAAGAPAMGRLRSEALAEVAAQSPKAVTDRLQWASGRYAASWWTQVSKDEGRREEAGGRASARARQAPPPTPPPAPSSGSSSSAASWPSCATRRTRRPASCSRRGSACSRGSRFSTSRRGRKPWKSGSPSSSSPCSCLNCCPFAT